MKKFPVLFFLLIFFLPGNIFAKQASTDTISVDNLKSGLTLHNYWRYKTGDDHSWAEKDFDDSGWRMIIADSTKKDTMLLTYKGISWFRAPFVIDSSINGINLALQFRTNGASDVFIDGRLIRSLGIVGKTEKEQVSGFSLLTVIVPIPVNTPGRHLLAIRTSNYNKVTNIGALEINIGENVYEMETEIVSMQQALDEEQDISSRTIPVFFSGVFIVLSIFHLILFLYYRKNRSNLYYGLFTLFLFTIFFGFFITLSGTDIQLTKKIMILEFMSFFLVPLFFIGILYEVFYKRLLKMFWVFIGILLLSLFFMVILNKKGAGVLFLFLFLLAGFVETIRVFIRAWVKKREGSRIFIFGILFPVIGVIVLSVLSWILEYFGFNSLADKISDHTGEFFGYSLLMSVSISMTIYLARDFARVNRKLYDQLIEIKQLFDLTIEQDSEKKRILENQKEELERMVVLRTEEVVRQKATIEQKNRDILDNLLYARRIQDAILPEIRLIHATMRESFIIYLPKDIVSGDFYSFSQREGKVIISAADCTGHGVTGAFMSMIGSSVLNQIINERGITQPSLILNHLNTGITEALKQKENDVTDGMDIALCTFDLKTLQLQYAGANRPLWLFRNGEYMEIKPDKLAIGGFRIRRDATFTNHELRLQHGDTIYLFSDGYADQFGGQYGKKLLSKHFREILTSLQNLSMRDQEKQLTEIFNEWKGNMTQVDDVLVMGIRI